MEFKFNDSTLWEQKENCDREANSYMILSKSDDVKDVDFDII